MNMAWKEMKKSKTKFIIVGAIIFLISFLTFIISGLANGLSHDNSALIKNLPNGHFYMSEGADDNYSMSKINPQLQSEILSTYEDSLALSIQMGFLNDSADKPHSVAFVAATPSTIFPTVNTGQVIIDRGVEEDGILAGDTLKNDQYEGDFSVTELIKGQKFSHAEVAFVHEDDYKQMYRTDSLQLIFIPGKDAPTIDGLVSYSNKEFLNTIPSYMAEQMTLNMIIWFLVGISGLLFAIFFYMMNVQKIGLYGILKAIGVKTSTLFRMMWMQMFILTIVSLVIAIAISQLFALVAPAGMPFHLTIGATLLLSLLFIIIGFVGTTLSGLQIKKIAPLQAIQQGEM